MKAQLVKQCEQRFVEKRCVTDTNGNTSVSVGNEVTAIIVVDCNGMIKESYWGYVAGVMSLLDPQPVVDVCNDCQPSVEFQCVRFTEIIPPGPGSGWLQGRSSSLMSFVNVTDPLQPIGCADPGVTEYPVIIKVSGGVGAATFGPITLTVNSPSDWTPDLISSVLNAQPMYSAIGVTWLDDYVGGCVFPSSVSQEFWCSFSDKPSGAGCSEFGYGYGYLPSTGYSYDKFGGPLIMNGPSGPGWNQGGSLAAPNNGTGATVTFPVAEIKIPQRKEFEVVKCVNAKVTPPIVTVDRYNLDGTSFIFPPLGTTAEDVVFSAGPCGVETESREVCLDTGAEAWLIVGRDTVTGEAVWSRVEDLHGNEIVGATLAECNCGILANVNTRCLSYGTSINGYAKDQMNTPPCAAYQYAVAGEFGGTPFSFNFSVSGSWAIGDVGYGNAPQAITDAFNAAALAAGINEIQLAGANPVSNGQFGIAVLHNSTGQNWWMTVTESAPACAVSSLGININTTWYFEKDGVNIGEAIYDAGASKPYGQAAWPNFGVQQSNDCAPA